VAEAAGHRPVLAIVYGEGSPSAMALKAAAAPVCDVVWVVDSSEANVTWSLRLLQKLGQVVDTAGLSEDEIAERVRPLHPDGIVAYADAHMERTSLLAGRLALAYHDPEVVQRVIDKSIQRAALRRGGLPVPGCAVVPPAPSPDQVDALLETLSFPVVIKPRLGSASRETHLVHNAAELRALIADVATNESELSMVVEEYMAGATPPPSEWFSDYVSIESVVVDGQISHLAVTGRLHQAKPFRETGLIIPSDFPPALQTEVLQIATQAIIALGIRIGCLHTEIKITDEGPRVIEVNGRIGGFVPEVLALAAPHVNLHELSMRVALGERVAFPDLVVTKGVGYVIVRQPPQTARRVASVEGLDHVGQ
jgi:biotin carboxylase